MNLNRAFLDTKNLVKIPKNLIIVKGVWNELNNNIIIIYNYNIIS